VWHAGHTLSVPAIYSLPSMSTCFWVVYLSILSTWTILGANNAGSRIELGIVVVVTLTRSLLQVTWGGSKQGKVSYFTCSAKIFRFMMIRDHGKSGPVLYIMCWYVTLTECRTSWQRWESTETDVYAAAVTFRYVWYIIACIYSCYISLGYYHVLVSNETLACSWWRVIFDLGGVWVWTGTINWYGNGYSIG
jgi:hypothetical protein